MIAVDPSDSTGSDGLDFPERCRVVKLANSITYDRYVVKRVQIASVFKYLCRMEKILDQLENIVVPSSTSASSQSPSQLVRVLLGLSELSEPVSLSNPITFYDQNLNPSQQAAVKFALEASEVACIHGPPGTGKTWTLVEIIRQLVGRTDTPLARSVESARPAKVLICGASNLAVDNILERLLALPEHLDLTRIGHPARVMTSGVQGQKMLEATLEVQAGRSDQVRHPVVTRP